MAQIINLFNIDLSELVWRLRLFSSVLSVLFGFLIVYSMVKFKQLVHLKIEMANAIRPPESAQGGALQSKWEEIMRHANSTQEAEWKFAVIEADKLIDGLLKSSGYLGDTMGERMMNIEKGQLLTLDGLWEAHKIRNKLVHDTNYFLRYAEARRAIIFYKQTLQELGGM